jgi:hypothetical protein
MSRCGHPRADAGGHQGGTRLLHRESATHKRLSGLSLLAGLCTTPSYSAQRRLFPDKEEVPGSSPGSPTRNGRKSLEIGRFSSLARSCRRRTRVPLGCIGFYPWLLRAKVVSAVSALAAWLEQWCPECRAAPGGRCRRWQWARSSRARSVPVTQLHIAHGWFERRYPTCRALPVTGARRRRAVRPPRCTPLGSGPGDMSWCGVPLYGRSSGAVARRSRSSRSPGGPIAAAARTRSACFGRSARNWSTSSAGRHATSFVTRSRRRDGIAWGPSLGTHEFGARLSGWQRTGAW